jgi:peptidoglycan/LPS O-acetylase OafA/YrhL
MKFAQTPLSYMPQLDGIRGIAVMLVMFRHWLPQEDLINFLPLGRIGVDIFFVLSGFLITKILLKERFESDASLSTGKKIYTFYIRRSLRIFPVYYLLLLVVFIINLEGSRGSILWYATYATNFFLFKEQSWVNHLSHLWTLAVEEQFYLFWPFVILFVPKNKLLKVIQFFIVLGPLSRAIFYLINPSIYNNILTINCIDTLSLGGLLAYIHMGYYQFTISKAALYNILVALIAVVFLSAAGLLTPVIDTMFHSTAVALLALVVIHKASTGFEGSIGAALENKSLLYMGKISYGLYLYHNFIPLIYQKVFDKFNLRNVTIPFTDGFTFAPILDNKYLTFPLYLLTVLVIASLSWFLLERPLNNLKNRYGYKRKPNSVGSVSTI